MCDGENAACYLLLLSSLGFLIFFFFVSNEISVRNVVIYKELNFTNSTVVTLDHRNDLRRKLLY